MTGTDTTRGEVGADPTSPSSVALLVDLVTNTLDPGYAAASERKRAAAPAGRFSGHTDRLAVAIGCLLIGFVLVVGYVHEHRSAPAAAKVDTALIGRVRVAESAGASLADSVQQLSNKIDNLRAQSIGGSGPLNQDIQRDELLAGNTAVQGPGVEVQLADPAAPTPTQANARAGTTPIGAVQVLTDRDVSSVVNQLWADGAEAISVNGVRLTPTSAIRFAGEAVLVDFEPITSPYLIRAIGNADQLDTGFAASEVASRYQTLAAADGITFRFDEQKLLRLPASAPFTPLYARVPTATTTAGVAGTTAGPSPATSVPASVPAPEPTQSSASPTPDTGGTR
ncbi:MAG TPA: DUF881 domain-containing protein [Jatrophihabitantaceae bacterium]|jgi:uncharacterized protein YlxW (UPF0749 family)|nr:DUF881 domain-containing protein [Jatrophihabitantaceae bacterium]